MADDFVRCRRAGMLFIERLVSGVGREGGWVRG